MVTGISIDLKELSVSRLQWIGSIPYISAHSLPWKIPEIIQMKRPQEASGQCVCSNWKLTGCYLDAGPFRFGGHGPGHIWVRSRAGWVWDGLNSSSCSPDTCYILKQLKSWGFSLVLLRLVGLLPWCFITESHREHGPFIFWAPNPLQ